MARPILFNSPKFKLLAQTAKLPRAHVLGLLEFMWSTCHETGNPVVGNWRRVEAACEWTGPEGQWFHALMACGFIERDDSTAVNTELAPDWQEALTNVNWRIHDYDEHAPDYALRRRKRELERQREKACEHCGGQYRSSSPTSRYCSKSCRVMACRRPVSAKLAPVSAKLAQPAHAHAHAHPVLSLEKKVPKKRAREEDDFAELVPAELRTLEFMEAWQAWLADRKERKKTVTERGAKGQLGKLVKVGPILAIEAINASIEHGWTGLFTENRNGTTRPGKATSEQPKYRCRDAQPLD